MSAAEDRQARILSLRPVVVGIARQYAGHDRTLLDDLVSEGWVGAIRAVDSHRPKAGASLQTYANVRIRGAVLDYLRAVKHLVSGVNVRRQDDRDPRRMPCAPLESAYDVPTRARAVEDQAVDFVETQRFLAGLDRRTAAIVAERVGLAAPLTAVAARHGIDGSRVSQITTAVLRASVSAGPC